MQDLKAGATEKYDNIQFIILSKKQSLQSIINNVQFESKIEEGGELLGGGRDIQLLHIIIFLLKNEDTKLFENS